MLRSGEASTDCGPFANQAEKIDQKKITLAAETAWLLVEMLFCSVLSSLDWSITQVEAVPCLLTSCFICAKGSNDQPRHTSKAKLVRARAAPRWGGQVGGGRGPRGADRESPGAVDGRDVLPPGQGPGLKRAPHPRASACMCASRLSSNQQCTRPRLYLRAYLNTDPCKPALPCPPHHLRDP